MEAQSNAIIPKDNIKNRFGRLAVFARGNSDSQAHYNASSTKHEAPQPRSQSPQAAAPTAHPLTREGIAESARIAMPQPSRNQIAPLSPRKILPQSPRKIATHSPVRQARGASPESVVPSEVDETRRTLFEGSQLGENFMNSGLTTPQNELDDAYLERVVEKPSEPHTREDENKDTRYSRLNRGFGSKSGYHFQVTEGGKFAVQPGTGWRSPSDMRDGFQKDAFNEPRESYQDAYHRSSSPGNAAKHLPIREVKIRKPHNPAKDNRAARDSPKKQSVALTNPRWPIAYKEVPQQTSMVINLDDEDDEQDQEQTHETPKAKKDTEGPRPALLESSMPPVMNLANTRHHTQDKKRGRASPDYDDQALSSMSAAALQGEPFDWDPAQAVRHTNGGDAASLTDKLEQFSRQSEREQRAFFAAMSMDDWEKSGDWFVDQFAALMTKLRDARRDKRQTMKDFEDEAFNREEAVRLRSEAIDRKLGKMRQDGQRVVGDRYF